MKPSNPSAGQAQSPMPSSEALRAMSPSEANEAKHAAMPADHPLKNLGQRIADAMNKAAAEDRL